MATLASRATAPAPSLRLQAIRVYFGVAPLGFNKDIVMPTYTVVHSVRSLTADAKSCIAAAITRAHQEITGAPGYFAQVIFQEVASDAYFVGGKVLEGDQVFVSGQIRSGRDTATKRRLLQELVAVTAIAGDLAADRVWVYLSELPEQQMAEFGHTLPAAGEEAAWFEALPHNLRDRLKKLKS